MNSDVEKPVAVISKERGSTPPKAKRSRLVWLAALIIIVLLAVAGYILIQTGGGKHSASYSRQQITNGGYTYSVVFDKKAKQITQKATHSLEGTIPDTTQKQTFTASPVSNIPELKDCVLLGIGWKSDFSFSLNGSNYHTCSLNNTAYLTLIKSGQQQHIVRLTASGTDKNGHDAANAKSILSSLVISKS